MAPKQGLASPAGHMLAESMEEVNVSGEKRRKWHSRHVCSTVLCYILDATFSQILEVLRDFHRLLDPETVQLPAFSILSAMFTGTCGPPEKLSTVLQCSGHDCETLLKFTVSHADPCTLTKETTVSTSAESACSLEKMMW